MDLVNQLQHIRADIASKRGTAKVNAKLYPRLEQEDVQRVLRWLFSALDTAKPRLQASETYEVSYERHIVPLSRFVTSRPNWTRSDVAATFWELVSAAMLWLNGAGFVKTKDEAWTEARAEATADVADVTASAAGAAWDGAKAIAGAPGAVLNAGKDAASTAATVLKVAGIGAALIGAGFVVQTLRSR